MVKSKLLFYISISFESPRYYLYLEIFYGCNFSGRYKPLIVTLR